MEIPRGDSWGGKRQWGAQGYLETQKRAERQRVVLKENLGTSDIPLRKPLLREREKQQLKPSTP